MPRPQCILLPMRGTTGRAVSAAIHSRLREALARGEPLTYAQLATEAGCTVRSVRNYLAHSREIFGFDVLQSRAKGVHSVLVRAVGVASQSPDDDLIRALAKGLHARLFPESSNSASGSLALRVSLRGIPVYGSYHESALRTWIAAVEQRPRRAVRLRVKREQHPHGELMVWALAAVVHNIHGILLAGLPIDADHADALRVVELEILRPEPDAVQMLERSDTGDPSLDLGAIDLGELLDLPFTTHPKSTDSKQLVNVHLRFSSTCANRLKNKLFHRSQRAVLRTDGTLDVRFGPVDLDTAASWAASFGDSVRVLGDKRLRRAVKKGSFCA